MNMSAKIPMTRGLSTVSILLFSMLAVVLPYLAFASPSHTPCNQKSPWVNDLVTYSGLQASMGKGGLLCLNLSSGAANLIDTDLNNYANVNITGVGCSTTFSVKDTDAADTYPAGYFAGFKVSSANLLSLSLGASVTVTTYNNNAQVESRQVLTSLVGLNASLLDGNGNATLGFVTTAPFDEVRIKYDAGLLGVLLTGQVYHAVIEKFCPATALSCNSPAPMSNPTYPTVIDTANTGITGLACVGCQLNEAENLISSDPADYATLKLTAAVGAVGNVAVKDVLTDYPAGTFAGFDISNPNLLTAGVLSGITLRTYLNGAPTGESAMVGRGNLVIASSSLLNGTGNQRVGFFTTLPFDEIKLEFAQLVGVDLGDIRIYNAIFEKFCPGAPLSCGASTYLAGPAYPAMIDIGLTGIDGVACALCSVDNTANLIDADPSNHADIYLDAGVLASGSVAVRDVLSDYPAGTFAGFDIENPTLLELDLLNATTITTYRNGVMQESHSRGNLLTLRLLSSSRRIIGFSTTLPFDEVRLTLNGVVNVNIGTTHVYGAVLQGGGSGGTTTPPTLVISPPASATNACPVTTVNLNDQVLDSTPNGAQLLWYDNPNHSGTPVANPASVSVSGTYYAFHRDAASGCFSPGSPLQVTISPCPVTNTPDAVDDAYTTPAGTPRSGNVAANDTVPPQSNFTVASGASHGSVTLDPNGGFTYTPTPGYAGPDSFTYRLCSAGSCDTATVSITVGPDAVDDTITTTAGTPRSGNVSTNDRFATGSTFAAASNPSHGTHTLNADGSFTYTPATGYVGQDSFVYQLCASGGSLCDTATVTITVTGSEVPPQANNDSVTTPYDQTVTVLALSNDAIAQSSGTTTDFLDPATLDLDPTLPGIQDTRTLPGEGTFSASPNGSVDFTPDTGFNGTASTSYTVGDSGGHVSNTALITIMVQPPVGFETAVPPVANADFATTTGTGPVTLPVLSNDTGGMTNAGTPTRLRAAASTVDLDPATPDTQNSLAVPGGTFTVNSDGTVNFTPTAGFSGTVTASYIVRDTAGEFSAPASLTVAVGGGANVVAVNDQAQTPADTAFTIPVLNNDLPSLSANLDPTRLDLDPGTAGIQSGVVLPGGSLTANSNGTVSFAPKTGFVGTVSLSYAITDSADRSGTATLTILVTPIMAMAVDDVASTVSDTPVTLRPASNDSTRPPAVLNPSTVDLDPTTPGIETHRTTAEGTWSVTDVLGSVRFMPNTGFSSVAELPYAVSDSLGNIATATISVTVASGTGLSAVDDTFTTPAGTPLSGNVAANDMVPADSTFAVSGGPSSGTLSFSPDGSFTYTPVSAYTGAASFNYQACAPGGAPCDAATVYITVGPNAVDDTDKTPSDTPLTGNVAANDTVPAGSTFAVESGPANGTLNFAPDGGYTYTPAPAYAGPDSFVYQVCAPGGTPCDTATVSIAVTALAQAAQLTIQQTTSTHDPSMGLPFTYTLTVTNTGGAATNPALIAYPPTGITLVSLSGGAGWTCTPSSPLPLQGGSGATLACTKASMAVGSEVITLTAVPTAASENLPHFVTIQGDGDTPPANPSTANCNATHNCAYTEVTPRNPGLGMLERVALSEDGNGDGRADAGDRLAYVFVLANTGDTAIAGVTLVDIKLDAGTLSCNPKTTLGAMFTPGGTLQKDDSVACTATHTVTAAEAAEDRIGNAAVGFGFAPDGKPVQSAASGTWQKSTETNDNSRLKVVETAVHHDANGNGVFDSGETLRHAFLVRNTGTTALTDIAVAHEPAFTMDCGDGTPHIASLEPGAQVSCAAPDQVLTALDVENGFVAGTTAVAGIDPNAYHVSDSDTLVLISGQPAGLSLAKSAVLSDDAGGIGLSEGDTLTYTLVATNTGSVPLTHITVSDDRLETPLACAPAQGSTLNPGAQLVCTGTYLVQNGAANPVDNQASVTAIPSGRLRPVFASGSLVLPY